MLKFWKEGVNKNKPHNIRLVECDNCNKEFRYGNYHDLFVNEMQRDNDGLGTGEVEWKEIKSKRVQYCDECFRDKFQLKK